MITMSRRMVLASSVALAACSAVGSPNAGPYTFECPPCGCKMDDVVFNAPGRCPDCGMILQPVIDAQLGFAPDELPVGAGIFGLSGSQSKRFIVHYFRPANFTNASPVLLVIPGAGRNSAEYRNAWLAAAVQKGMLIASLGYPEEDYDFAAYNMGGLVRNLSFNAPEVVQTSRNARTVSLDDADIIFELNPDSNSWLFNDFDTVFDQIVAASGSTQQNYDIFGHSAGGQILHRMAMFHQESKARRIVAANAGFYTLPLFNQTLPTGIKETVLNEARLSDAFAKRLIIMLGENDNGDAAGGTLLKTPRVNQQGPGRLQRGEHFFDLAAEVARRSNTMLNWDILRVPDVGHDFEAMSLAAAGVLYPE